MTQTERPLLRLHYLLPVEVILLSAYTNFGKVMSEACMKGYAQRMITYLAGIQQQIGRGHKFQTVETILAAQPTSLYNYIDALRKLISQIEVNFKLSDGIYSQRITQKAVHCGQY